MTHFSNDTPNLARCLDEPLRRNSLHSLGRRATNVGVPFFPPKKENCCVDGMVFLCSKKEIHASFLARFPLRSVALPFFRIISKKKSTAYHGTLHFCILCRNLTCERYRLTHSSSSLSAARKSGTLSVLVSTAVDAVEAIGVRSVSS